MLVSAYGEYHKAVSDYIVMFSYFITSYGSYYSIISLQSVLIFSNTVVHITCPP